MKKLILAACLPLLYSSLLAQHGKIGVKTAPKVLKPRPLLATLNDSASYAIGLSIAGFCKQQSIAAPNTALVSQSCADVLENKTPLITEAGSNDIINRLLMHNNGSGQPTLKSTDSTLRTISSMSANDSVSYAIGLNHALFFKQQGVSNLDTTFIVRAITDVLGNKPLQFNDRVANGVMNKLIISIQESKVKPTIDAGRAFLANNKKKPKVKTTASGLQYEVIRLGKGIKPTKTDTFVCNYKGTLIDGTEFDNSYKRNQPLVYPVTSVIRGWTEGLQLMPVGSKYNFYIPYELAYGPFDNQAIPGGSVLIFEVDLLGVKKGKVSPAAVKPKK